MKNKVVFASLFIAIVSLGLSVYGLSRPQKATAYFDYNEVYNSCKLKQKLETDLREIGSMRQSELDSMKLELSFLAQKFDAGKLSNAELDEFENAKARFLNLQSRYEEEGNRLKETYHNQIREEINTKARMFAEKNNLNYLFAAMGDGAIMYGAEPENVTKKFHQFLDEN